MEKAILNMLQWNITIPTPYVFFLQFAAAVTSSDLKNDEGRMAFSKPSMVDAADAYGSMQLGSCSSQEDPYME